MTRDIARRLRFSNEDTEQIVVLVANHMRFKDVEQMRAATLKRFIRLPRFDEHLELHRLDCVSSHGRLESYEFVRRTLAETPAEQIRPQRLLTGEDLLEMGYRPGPIFSEMLRGVEDAQLEGVLRTKEEARKYVLDSFGRTERQMANKHGRQRRNHEASGGI
jgi:poly(A) polymerase